MLVVPNSSFLAKEKAKEEGIDVDNWTMMEQLNYREKYAEKYGRLSYLNELKIPKGNYTPENIRLIRDTVCQLFLKLKTSYEFNNDDPDCDPTLYYPDRIEFSPYDFNFDYLPYVKTFYAPGASIND